MYSNVGGNNHVPIQSTGGNSSSQTAAPARTLDDWLNYPGGWITCKSAPIRHIHLGTGFLSEHLKDRTDTEKALYLPMLSAFHGDAEMEGRTFFKGGGLMQNNRQVFRFNYSSGAGAGKQFFTAHCKLNEQGVVTGLSINPKLLPASLENARASLDSVARKLNQPDQYGPFNFASDPVIMGGLMNPYSVDYLVNDLNNPRIAVSDKLDWIIELNHRSDFARCTPEDKRRAVQAAQTFLNGLAV